MKMMVIMMVLNRSSENGGFHDSDAADDVTAGDVDEK